MARQVGVIKQVRGFNFQGAIPMKMWGGYATLCDSNNNDVINMIWCY